LVAASGRDKGRVCKLSLGYAYLELARGEQAPP
jgi:hypothetical protein